MKTLLPAVILGMLLGAGLMLAVPRDAPPRTLTPDGPEAPPVEQTAPDRDLSWREPSGGRVESPDRATTSFPAGTAVLRIGDGLRFGEDHALPGAEGEEVDLLCLDIHDGVSIRCPQGGETALLPLARPGGSPAPLWSYDLLFNAPAEHSKEIVLLRLKAAESESGVCFVRSRDGRSFKVVIAALHSNPHALKRSVKILYSEVPSVPGGGVVPIPGGVGSSRVEEERAVAIRKLFEAPSEIHPSYGYSHRMKKRDFVTLGKIPESLDITGRGAYLLPEALNSTVKLGVFGLLYLEGGMTGEGRVELDSQSNVVVEGEMAGTIKCGSGYIRIQGDLTGTVISSGTVVIDGDLLGTLELSGIPQVLIRGTVRDPTTAIRGNGIPHIFIGGYTPRSQVVSFPDQSGIWSLSLAQSDIPAGKHRGISFWSQVVVGDEIWKTLLR